MIFKKEYPFHCNLLGKILIFTITNDLIVVYSQLSNCYFFVSSRYRYLLSTAFLQTFQTKDKLELIQLNLFPHFREKNFLSCFFENVTKIQLFCFLQNPNVNKFCVLILVSILKNKQVNEGGRERRGRSLQRMCWSSYSSQKIFFVNFN